MVISVTTSAFHSRRLQFHLHLGLWRGGPIVDLSKTETEEPGHYPGGGGWQSGFPALRVFEPSWPDGGDRV